jgi:hypothetical protein
MRVVIDIGVFIGAAIKAQTVPSIAMHRAVQRGMLLKFPSTKTEAALSRGTDSRRSRLAPRPQGHAGIALVFWGECMRCDDFSRDIASNLLLLRDNQGVTGVIVAKGVSIGIDWSNTTDKSFASQLSVSACTRA